MYVTVIAYYNAQKSANMLQLRPYQDAAGAIGHGATEGCSMIMSRVWAMPNPETFSVRPIGNFVRKRLIEAKVSVDPFARDKRWATHTNDLNPATAAEHHMDAEAFCRMLHNRGVVADLAIFDPPYSPRQISEVYKSIGLPVSAKETQNARLYKRCRDALDLIVPRGGVVLSFGWNSAGMGSTRGYEIEEILLVAHGGGHNDTICVAERKQ